MFLSTCSGAFLARVEDLCDSGWANETVKLLKKILQSLRTLALLLCGVDYQIEKDT